jgi:hypothetical protein
LFHQPDLSIQFFIAVSFGFIPCIPAGDICY